MAKNEGDFRCGPPPFARRRRSSILKPSLPLDCLGNETCNPSRPLRRVSFAGHLQLKNYNKEDAGLYDELHFVPVQLGDHTSPVPPLERNEGSPLKQSVLTWDADVSKFGDGMQMEPASFIHNVIRYRGNSNFLNKTVLETVDMSISGIHDKSMFEDGEISMSLCDASMMVGPQDSSSESVDMSLVGKSFLGEPCAADMSISQGALISTFQTTEHLPTPHQDLQNSPSVADMSLSQAEFSLDSHTPTTPLVESSNSATSSGEIPLSPSATDLSEEEHSSEGIQEKSVPGQSEMSMSLVTSSPLFEAKIIANEWKLADGDSSVADMSLSQSSITSISDSDHTLNVTTKDVGFADMSIANNTPDFANEDQSKNNLPALLPEESQSLTKEPAENEKIQGAEINLGTEHAPFAVLPPQKSPPSSPSQHSQAMSISDCETDRLNESSASSDNTFDSSFDLLMQQTRKCSLEHAGVPVTSSPVLQPSDADSTFENSTNGRWSKSRRDQADPPFPSPKPFSLQHDMTADSSFHALIRTRISTFAPRDFTPSPDKSPSAESSFTGLLPENMKSTFDLPPMTPEDFPVDAQKKRHLELPNATMEEMPGGRGTSTMDFQTFNSPRPLAGENSFMVLLQTRKSSVSQPLLLLPETGFAGAEATHHEEEEEYFPDCTLSRSVLKEASVCLPTIAPISFNQSALVTSMESALVTSMESAVVTSMESALVTSMESALITSMESALVTSMESALITSMESALVTSMEKSLSSVLTPEGKEKCRISGVVTPGRNDTYMSKGITDVSRLDLYKTLMDIPSMYENEADGSKDSFPSGVSPLKLGETASGMSSFVSEAESASDLPMNITRFLAEVDFLPDSGDATFVLPGLKSCLGTPDFNSTVFSPSVGQENGGDDTFSDSLHNISALIGPIEALLGGRGSSVDRSHSSLQDSLATHPEAVQLTHAEESIQSDHSADNERTPLSETFVDHEVMECQVALDNTVMDLENLGLSSSDESEEDEYDNEFVHFVKSQLVDMMVYGVVVEQGVGKWTIELPGKRTVLVLMVKIPLTIEKIDRGIERIHFAAKMLVGKISQEKLEDVLLRIPKDENFISDTVLALRTLQSQEEEIMPQRPLVMRPPPAWTVV